jgi:hypothetical protein
MSPAPARCPTPALTGPARCKAELRVPSTTTPPAGPRPLNAPNYGRSPLFRFPPERSGTSRSRFRRGPNMEGPLSLRGREPSTGQPTGRPRGGACFLLASCRPGPRRRRLFVGERRNPLIKSPNEGINSLPTPRVTLDNQPERRADAALCHRRRRCCRGFASSRPFLRAPSPSATAPP